MRRLLNDLGSIVLAIVLGVIVWLVAVNEENPITRGSWPDPITIEYINKPENTVIVGDVPVQMRVTIQAPQTSWQDLRRESYRAWVDLTGATLGLNQLEVHLEVSDPNVDIVEMRPSAVAVRLETLKEVALPVRVAVLDSPPFGFEVKADEIAVTPDTVMVSGPEQLVNQVTQVVADVYLRGTTSTVERKVAMQARAAQGEAVNVALSPGEVTVRVPVVQRRGFRNLSIRVVWEGQPAPGYRISNVSVDPTIVTAIGDPATIESIPGYLETTPVNVDEATSDVEEPVALVLPSGVSLLSSQTVHVTISVTPIESSLTVQRQVVVQGLALNLNASPSPASVDVILSGPLPKLDSLRPADVQVIVDVFGLEAGSYQLTPIVIPPEGITVQSVVPERIQVELTAKPPASPSPTEPSSPTSEAATPTAGPTSVVEDTPMVPATPPPTAIREDAGEGTAR